MKGCHLLGHRRKIDQSEDGKTGSSPATLNDITPHINQLYIVHITPHDQLYIMLSSIAELDNTK